MTPAEIVDGQIRAYEAGDADAFCACFALDALCHELPSHAVLAAGRDGIRAHWAKTFAGGPRRVRITQRVEQGRFIVDHEEVLVIATGVTIDAVAIYLTGRDRIERAWFLTPATVVQPAR